jgi:hypothetical protein
MVSKTIWAKVLERDVCCWHCGRIDDTLVPQHRVNRGMGGSKLLDTPSNLVAMCSESNLLMESNAEFREKALQYGWKLERYKFPEATPIYDFYKGDWFLIDNQWNKTPYRLFMA